MRILYVEDNMINALVMQQLLDDREVILAENGEKGLEILSKDKNFDIFFIDINLGQEHMDGVQFLGEVKKIAELSEKPTFAITAYGLPEDEKRFLEAGFDYFYSKPVDMNRLRTCLSEL